MTTVWLALAAALLFGSAVALGFSAALGNRPAKSWCEPAWYVAAVALAAGAVCAAWTHLAFGVLGWVVFVVVVLYGYAAVFMAAGCALMGWSEVQTRLDACPDARDRAEGRVLWAAVCLCSGVRWPSLLAKRIREAS